ncbi:MAG: hypothetical protein RLY16_769 [Bacteroidota bacterium]
MNDFNLYFQTGWQHIISWDALDHLLFIAALAAIYQWHNWRQVLVLVTAFTIGHSLTLALSVYDIYRFNQNWVEFLIPITIIITAVSNLILQKRLSTSLRLNYVLALSFGLIHGMGFANTIRFMLASDQKIAIPLVSFNLGLEVGQILVVALLLSAGWLLMKKLQLERKYWVVFWSVICVLQSTQMAWHRWPL